MLKRTRHLACSLFLRMYRFQKDFLRHFHILLKRRRETDKEFFSIEKFLKWWWMINKSGKFEIPTTALGSAASAESSLASRVNSSICFDSCLFSPRIVAITWKINNYFKFAKNAYLFQILLFECFTLDGLHCNAALQVESVTHFCDELGNLKSPWMRRNNKKTKRAILSRLLLIPAFLIRPEKV